MKKNILLLIVVISLLSACTKIAPQTTQPSNDSPTEVSKTEPSTATALPEPTSTSTAVSTFPAPFADGIDPALDPVEIRIKANGDEVSALFYLKDVPAEMKFDAATSLDAGAMEYMWKVCFDVDNNVSTGATLGWLQGADYCLWAVHKKADQPTSTKPIDQAVDVFLSKLDGEKEEKVGTGSILADPEKDTIQLTATIPGINAKSLVYYEIYSGELGMDISSPLYDRLSIENSQQ